MTDQLRRKLQERMSKYYDTHVLDGISDIDSEDYNTTLSPAKELNDKCTVNIFAYAFKSRVKGY